MLPPSANPQGDSLFDDFAARIEYGYYSPDWPVLRAATEQLQELAGSSATLQYLLAYAQFRLAEAAGYAARDNRVDLLSGCVEAATSAAEGLVQDADPLILVAVCSWQLSMLEPLKAVLHERRIFRSIAAAQALDRDNPRLALLAAWQSQALEGKAQVRMRLRAAAAAFEATLPGEALLHWGEAETLVLLGTEYLSEGDLVRARDAVEEALSTAPGYWRALELRQQILGTAGG